MFIDGIRFSLNILPLGKIGYSRFIRCEPYTTDFCFQIISFLHQIHKTGPPSATVKIKRAPLRMKVRPETHNRLKPPKTCKKGVFQSFWGNFLSCVLRKKFQSPLQGGQNCSCHPLITGQKNPGLP